MRDGSGHEGRTLVHVVPASEAEAAERRSRPVSILGFQVADRLIGEALARGRCVVGLEACIPGIMIAHDRDALAREGPSTSFGATGRKKAVPTLPSAVRRSQRGGDEGA